MRTPSRPRFGLVVRRSVGTISRAIAVVAVLTVAAASAQAAEPEEKAEPKVTPALEGIAWKGTIPGKGGYREISVNEELRRKTRLEVQRMLRAGEVAEGDRATFEQYYKDYGLARWTKADHLSEVRDYRKELRNELRLASGTAAHDALRALAFDYLRQMAANEQFYPASRCNAMLCIGELNAEEAPSVSDAPEPFPEARPMLLAALTDADQHDAIRFAAMLGLYRHAQIGIGDAQFRNEELVPALLTLAQTKTAPGRSPEGQAWLRARAIDTLGALEDLGPQTAAAVDTLTAIVDDHEDDLLVRCAAAKALGSLTYPADHGLDPWKLTGALGGLASDACLEEFEQLDLDAEREQRARKGRRGMGGMMDMGSGMEPGSGMMPMGGPEYQEDDMYGGSGMPGGMYGRPKEEEKEDQTQANRRRLKARLESVVFALTGMDLRGRATLEEGTLPSTGVAGLAAGPPDTDNELIQGVLDRVRGLSAGCDTPRDDEEVLDRETLREKLGDLLKKLTAALAKGAPPEDEEPETTEPPADEEAAPPAKAPPGPAGKAAAKPAAKPPATKTPTTKAPAKPAAKAPAGNP